MCEAYTDCANCKHSLDIDSEKEFECELDGSIHECEDTCSNFEK